MSFSMQVKNELVKTEYESACCKKALLYGMCIFGKTFSAKCVSLQTENEEVAKLYADLLKELYNVSTVSKVSPRGRNTTVSVKEENDAAKLFRSFGHEGVASLKINHSNFDCENCVNAFIAGAFLACGTISAPEKDYHLEFTVPYLNLSKSLLTLIEELELKPKYTYRHGYNIVYFKESEAIEDENLEALAEIRYENADLSLSELAQMCNPPLSRSGVNHRLKKIMSIADEL